MGKMYDSMAQQLATIGEAVKKAENPRHRAILENYQKHVALEQAGRWHEILTPEMTVDKPHYRVSIGGEFIEYNGKEGVSDFYGNVMAPVVAVILDEKIAVADWGLASIGLLCFFQSGADLIAQGAPVEDPDGTYIVRFPMGMFWYYDENIKLIGENLYKLEDGDMIPADPDDILTKERMIESCDEYLATI